MRTLSPTPCLLLALLLAFAGADGHQTVRMRLQRQRPTDHLSRHDKVLQLVQATKARDQQLRRKRNPKPPKPVRRDSAGAEVNARGYGGYSVKISLGLPPQEIRVVMDTGSDLLWVPCTFNYTCIACSGADGTADGVYHPGRSTGRHLVTCRDNKCASLHGQSASLCGACNASRACAAVCPPYAVEYDGGATLGLLLSDTLRLPLAKGKQVAGFGFGCSLLSSELPSGVAGFGRGELSVPSQLAAGARMPDRFAYCLQSHRLDDRPDAGSFVVMGAEAAPPALSLNFTPLLKSPSSRGFYYVGLRAVSVGGERVRVPARLLRLDHHGNGGAIVDSGTTFSLLAPAVFRRIVRAMAAQIRQRRAPAVENATGLGLCYDLAGREKFEMPTLALHFKGGSDMVLPVANYFSLVDNQTMCLTMLPSALRTGPSVVLGNYQQQDFYFLYDRQHSRLGFSPHVCKTSPSRP